VGKNGRSSISEWTQDQPSTLEYSDFLEGSTKDASKVIRENLPEMAARIMPPGRPLAVIGLTRDELPRWFCTDEFESLESLQVMLLA